MSDALDKIMNLPDITFTDNMTFDDVKEKLFGAYNEKMKELTGEEYSLEDGDSTEECVRMTAQAVMYYQLILFIEHAGRMNFLKYAYGDYLDHLGIFKNTSRKEGEPAKVYIKFSLAKERENDEVIPSGTLVTADQKFFFSTKKEEYIPAGELSVTALCECTEIGSAANQYSAGDIDTLVTPTGFVAEVINEESSFGGRDAQTDDELKESIYQAPDLYSVAGKDDEWIVMSKEFNSDIIDVLPSTVPGSGIVDVMILMKDGLPTDNDIQTLQEYLLRNDKRTTTTLVHVTSPEKVEYSINIQYFIPESSKVNENLIQSKVEEAIDEYIKWQSGKIGRDINPDELIFRIRLAGAKRVEITNPTFTKVFPSQVAFVTEKNVVYGGIEDD